MTLEEAEAKIKELEESITTYKTEIVGLKDNAKNLVSKEDLEKAVQKADNVGFDRAKNKFEGEKKDLLNKADVEEMLKQRDTIHNAETTLLKMGVKSPKKALKIIDEEDIASFGSEDFKADGFKEKYGDVIVFKEEGGGSHKPFLKDNKHTEGSTVTADNYESLPSKEKAKLTDVEKLALVQS